MLQFATKILESMIFLRETRYDLYNDVCKELLGPECPYGLSLGAEKPPEDKNDSIHYEKKGNFNSMLIAEVFSKAVFVDENKFNRDRFSDCLYGYVNAGAGNGVYDLNPSKESINNGSLVKRYLNRTGLKKDRLYFKDRSCFYDDAAFCVMNKRWPEHMNVNGGMNHGASVEYERGVLVELEKAPKKKKKPVQSNELSKQGTLAQFLKLEEQVEQVEGLAKIARIFTS